MLDIFVKLHYGNENTNYLNYYCLEREKQTRNGNLACVLYGYVYNSLKFTAETAYRLGTFHFITLKVISPFETEN